jgi:hypothetical protein
MAVLFVVLASAGCGNYEPAPVPPSSDATTSSAPSVPAAPVAESPAPPAAAAEASPSAAMPAETAAQTASAPAPPAETPQAPQETRVKADVGAGKKGHYGPGFITTPVSVYWRTQEMVAYRTQVPHALNLYKAEHGHFPKTQEEFFREILEKNAIKLPELPEGHSYVYDPNKGELQVSRPQ